MLYKRYENAAGAWLVVRDLLGAPDTYALFAGDAQLARFADRAAAETVCAWLGQGPLPPRPLPEAPPRSHLAPAAARAATWAAEVLALPAAETAFVDLETTGLRGHAEIVQVGVCSAAGDVLLEALVRPADGIPDEVIAIHGITPARVAGALPFPALYPALAALLTGRRVVSYNSAFDRRLLDQVCLRHDLAFVPWTSFECAMEAYADYVGETRPGGGHRWQPLPGAQHGAVADCRAMLAVLGAMAAAATLPVEDMEIPF